MGKKSEQQRRDWECWLAEISGRLDEAFARAQREQEAFAEEREAYEASAESARARMAELREEIAQARLTIGESLAILGDFEAQGRTRAGEIEALNVELAVAVDASFATLGEFEAQARARATEVDALGVESVAALDASSATLSTLEASLATLGEFEAQARARAAEIDALRVESVAAIGESLSDLRDLEVQGRARAAEIDALSTQTVAAVDASLSTLGELEAQARVRTAEIDALAVESAAAVDASLVHLRDRAAAQVDDEVARCSIEAKERIDAALRAIDQQAEEFTVQLTNRITELLDDANQELGDARERAYRSIDETVAAAQKMSREAQDTIVPFPVTVTETEPLEPAAPDAADAAPLAAPFASMWDEPAPLPAPLAVTWEEPVAVPAGADADPSDDGYFARLAAELRDDALQRAFPLAVNDNDLVTAPDLDPAVASGTATQLQERPDPFADRVARRPVRVGVSIAALTASVEVLARYAADERVRMEVVHVAAGGRPAAFLRLTAYNVAEWWEYHDIPARTDSKEPQAAVVGIGELTNALDLTRQGSDESEVVVQMAGDVTIGNLLLPDQPGTDPVLSYHRERIEHVDLGAADRSGLNVETQIGRVSISPRLVSFLRTRNYCSSEILLVDGSPCLAAQIASPTTGTSATIVSRLADENAPLDENTEERRNELGSAVAQLVRALSADTTADELEEVLASGIGYARRRAAAHPALPPAVILDLLGEGTEAIRAAAATNPSVNDAACALAVADASEIVRSAIAANPAVTVECLELLAADPVAQVREHAASNVRVTRDVLRRLAEDVDSSVRAAAAVQPDVDPEMLSALSHDPDPRVCAAVARNPVCPAELLAELLELVPEAVLANPGAPTAVLAAGSRIDASSLRTAVAANPATPLKQLQILARDPDADVVRAVAENPATPANLRRRARRRLSG